MKKIIFPAILFGGLILAACNNSGSSTDSVDSANAANKQNSSDTALTAIAVDKDAAAFAVAAANGGMMEVELGNMAQQQGKSQRVKDFGAMMVADHTRINEAMKSIASSKNITLPSMVGGDEKSNMDKLSKKTGADFDKAYMNMMLDDHKGDVKEFQNQAMNCKDSTLKNFAANNLPTLQKHLDSAMAITGKH